MDLEFTTKQVAEITRIDKRIILMLASDREYGLFCMDGGQGKHWRWKIMDIADLHLVHSLWKAGFKPRLIKMIMNADGEGEE